MAPWQPPIPTEKLYSPPALALDGGLALLVYCYDAVERGGWFKINLTETAAELGKPYRTIKHWWRQLREGPFFQAIEDHGRSGWRAQFAADWLDWRIVERNVPPDEGQPIALELPARAKNGALQGQPIAPQLPSRVVNGATEGQTVAPQDLHVGTHDPRSSMHDGGGLLPRMHARSNNPQPPPPAQDQQTRSSSMPEPPPPLSAPPPAPALPPAISQAAADWLGHALSAGERKQMLTLLGVYGADWLAQGVAASVSQGGRTLAYLDKLLAGCRADNRPPGSPKPGGPRGTSQPPARSGSTAAPQPPAPSPEEIAAFRNAPKLNLDLSFLQNGRRDGPGRGG